MPAYFGKTADNQFYYLLKYDENRSLIRRSFSENEPDKTVLLKEVLPGNDAHGGGGTLRFRPNGNTVVFARSVNPGSDTFKITSIFEDK